MEGGIAILLLLIIAVVVGGLAFGLFGTSGFLYNRKTHPSGDKLDDSERGERDRPRHTRPRTEAQEHTDFVRSGEDPDAPRRNPPAPPTPE